LQNVAEVVAHLQVEANTFHAATPSAQKHINKYFHLMKMGNVDRLKPYDCQIIRKS
jgi:hypothetical protein